MTTTFTPNITYLAHGAYGLENQTKEAEFLQRETVRGLECAAFKEERFPVVIEKDEVGEYVWLGCRWSVHSKDIVI